MSRKPDAVTKRATKLSNDLGIDLYAKYPRERLLHIMDVRPPDWKQTGWHPIHTEEQRVEAAWIFYSWSWPICMRYAVQIDADDEIMHDRLGHPMRMTQEKLAAVLGMHQPNVSRATKRLEARKELDIDIDGSVRVVPKPTLTIDERLAYLAMDLESVNGDREAYRGIPRRFRRRLADLKASLPEHISTDIFGEVQAACTTFNGALRDIRNMRDQVIEDVCTRGANLIVQTQTSDVVPRGRSLLLTEERAPHGNESERPPQTPPDTRRQQPKVHRADNQRAHHEAVIAEDEALLFGEIQRMQRAYPHTDFSAELVDPQKPADQVIVGRILSKIGPGQVLPFVTYVAAKFKGIDRNAIAKLPARSPDMPSGPRSLGLLLMWADDFAARRVGAAGV